MVNAAKKFGRMLGNTSNSIRNLQEDTLPDDQDQNFILGPFDNLKVTMTATGYSKRLSGAALILSHPIYGEMDNAQYPMDGQKYDGNGFEFTGTFPLSFSEVTGTSTLFTYTS